jgi:hypothetical protein
MTSGKPPNPASGNSAPKGYDPLLDPLPQPDVVESDSETAWGRWEALVASDGVEPRPEAEPEPDHPSFEDTMPFGDLDLPPLDKI